MAEGRLARLKALVDWARSNSDFYRARLGGVSLDVEDEGALLRQIPILRRDQAQALARGPASPLACVDPNEFVRFHHTSGSTGVGSLWVFDTQDDWDNIVGCWSTALSHYGIGRCDRALVCAGYGRFIGFWGLHEALISAGALTVSGADADSEARAVMIAALGVTVVATTPTYALRLGAELAQMGVDSPVRLVITSGEPRPPETKRRIEALWGCETYDTAGMTEMGTISMLECPDRDGSLHLMDDVFIEEVLDRETEVPVAHGELGVRVVTTLARRGMPFIRYWTNDLVVRELADCRCQLGDHVYTGGIRGRLDEMVKIDGVWFMPLLLEQVVRGYDEIVEYRATLHRSGDDRNTLFVELDATIDVDVAPDFIRSFTADCKRQLGFRPRVALASDLPRFEAKAKRFHDAREVVTA